MPAAREAQRVNQAAPGQSAYEESALPQPDQRDRIGAADAELDAVAARTIERLRRQQPGLFDARGRLRQRALRRLLTERAAGKTMLTKADVLALRLYP